MPALDHLAGLFYTDLAPLGTFTEVLAEQVPQPYRQLLAHHEHMTVSVERFHASRVDVEVLATRTDGDFYSRKIVLHRQSDGRPVLFGIPRLNLRFLDDEVREEIQSERIPLGRVLIEHNILREVQLGSLYRIVPGPDLCAMFRLTEPTPTYGQTPTPNYGRTPTPTYGRTAFIYLDGYLAIELLEIVPPE